MPGVTLPAATGLLHDQAICAARADTGNGLQPPAQTTAAARDFPDISVLYEIDHFRVA
ncbi:hypothetical protein GCM10010253_45660 [Streptomyces badius]|uniref:Uncharacterized protein n=1 Tax=Streptomyces badius TaxID=1941 RepID=A0ABQ2TE08_STRBA|nr:hypothetical protein GCM10010253_45660 [Streptomyces badius]